MVITILTGKNSEKLRNDMRNNMFAIETTLNV